WFSMSIGQSINPSNRVMGMQQSWISGSYLLMLKQKGSFLQGNSITNKEISKFNKENNFEYLLFISEDNKHAIEAEKYSDGKLIVYSTIYHDDSAIEEINLPESKVYKAQEINPNIASAEAKKIQLTEVTNIKKVENNNSATNEILSLDINLAGKIISEAQRNKMSPSDLVRKVIDMPASIGDMVMMNFSLSDDERKKLAERYNLSESDNDMIKQKIIDELNCFVGNRK
ncbi:MAG: hypothetical protein WCJ33_04615, partial [Pseudomonadota bacterium]